MSLKPFDRSGKWRLPVVLAVLASLLFVATQIHGFLAITHRVNASVLVVEGWIWDSEALQEAAVEFKQGRYSRLVTVGIAAGKNGYETAESNVALLAANRLEALGVNQESIVVLSVPDVPFHRTYSSALAVRRWAHQSSLQITGLNVFTSGVHARKSLVLFQRAFGPSVKIGVVAGLDETYDHEFWWLSPRGVYIVARKAVGYVYASLWPFPSETANSPA